MPPIRILYVEDNEDLRETVDMALQAPDREVLCCGSGEEAMALVEAGPFDVVITDVTLPGMSGIDLARDLVARDPRQRLVLCSGYDMRQELAPLGPQARALVKPFDLDALDHVLATVGVPPPAA